ncbi:hypothetical protein IFM89_021897 [Coptis chinensis]|uniref:Uncharacterized protein n=1 Tax=Coptis chinensis TaxID=261450 RepID=A0A835HGD7_9MAGN|nr:hypothetical protein IFM89_021897 [Coptis chinensis]
MVVGMFRKEKLDNLFQERVDNLVLLPPSNQIWPIQSLIGHTRKIWIIWVQYLN